MKARQTSEDVRRTVQPVTSGPRSHDVVNPSTPAVGEDACRDHRHNSSFPPAAVKFFGRSQPENTVSGWYDG